jgi:hypothetical protein
MKVAIDTNSLISLVRYYLPFDKDLIFYNFFKKKIEFSEIIIIDKVLEECEYFSKGLVLKSLDFLNDKIFLKSNKLPIKTEYILAPSPEKFLRQVDNQFVNRGIMKQKNISEVEYENRKNKFLNDADIKLILYCLNLKVDLPDDDIFLVTEESEGSNDDKLFKKIPSICKELNIENLTLPQLIGKYEGIDLVFK